MALTDEEINLLEEMTAQISNEEKDRIKYSVKNYLENNEIIYEAKKILAEYREIENIPEEVFYESEFNSVRLYAFCRIYDERRKNPLEM